MSWVAAIREATLADGARLAELLGVQLREHGVALDARALADSVDGMLRRPQKGRFLVACDRDAIVGFAALSFLWTLERGGRAAWLDELYVVPERRGAGVGLDLVHAAYAVAAAAGAAALDLEVEAGHERVESLYRREGFRPLTRRRWTRPLAQPAAPDRIERPAAACGGCLCGAVRYRISAPPIEVSHCHCGICRRASGAPFVTWATVPAAAFEIVSGRPVERASSPCAVRSFCAACGTALTFREVGHSGWVDVTVGSLDEPDRFPPDEHIFTSSQLSWLRIDDDLVRHLDANPREAGTDPVSGGGA